MEKLNEESGRKAKSLQRAQLILQNGVDGGISRLYNKIIKLLCFLTWFGIKI